MTSSSTGHRTASPTCVVAIGASAGGLKAIEAIFQQMPAETGLTFVILQHLSAEHKSSMPELLTRMTSIPVRVAENGVQVHPNHIYLLPSDSDMIIANHRLVLKGREKTKIFKYPINTFFTSLAKSYQKNCVAVVLSGSGVDGSKGVVAVHATGGLVLVQDPTTCQFNSMPLNAKATGIADLILPPEQISDAILAHLKRRQTGSKDDIEDFNPDAKILKEITSLLKDRFTVDFSQYKPSSITRRLARRLSLRNASDIRAYKDLLHSDPSEREALHFDLLIGVTQFFRDKQYFQALKAQLPRLFEVFNQDTEIRLWVTGCATGQEAYSLAILLNEFIEEKNYKKTFKIFATDIHKRSIMHAASGIYTEHELEGLSLELREKYFSKTDEKYQVNPTLRKTIIFAQQNLLRDPPFTKMHIISCRNLLIYLNTKAQERVVGLLSFSLLLNGLLFLGSSETLGKAGTDLSPLNSKAKIFHKRNDINRRPVLELSKPDYQLTSRVVPQAAIPSPESSFQSKRAMEALLQEYVPPSLLTDQEGNILRVFGEAKDFITFRTGEPSLNIRSLLGSPARTVVSQMLNHVRQNQRPLKTKGVEGFTNHSKVDIQISPLSRHSTDLNCFIISLSEAEISATDKSREDYDEEEMILKYNSNLIELEEELKHTKDSLQSTVEALETSNEELQSSNEELIASNEELQSTNEELQSVNEELYTVNAEYQAKESERAELEADQRNIMEMIGIAVILLDEDLRIRKYSPAAAEIFKLQIGDEGRPFSAVAQPGDKDIYEWAKDCLEKGAFHEDEIITKGGNSYLVKVSPYHHFPGKERQSTKQSGITIALTDNTAMRFAKGSLETSEKRYQDILDSISDGFFEWNSNSDELYVQSDFKASLGHSPTQCLTLDDFLGHRADDFRKQINFAAKEDKLTLPLEIWKQSGQSIWVICKCKVLKSGRVMGILIDISELKRKEQESKIQTVELKRSNKLLEEFAYIVSHDLKAPLRHIRNYLNFLEEAIQENDREQAFKEIEALRTSSSRLDHLVDDIITLSRVSSEKPNFTPVNLNQALKNVLTILGPTIEEKKVSITVEHLPEIHGNRPLLEHLFQNLISNACKYNDKEEPCVNIKYKDTGNAIIIEVEDNGIGFSDQYRDLVFKPFKRLVPNTQYEGSGIGLAICKTIAEQHFGEICAESILGVGSKFIVKLPKMG